MIFLFDLDGTLCKARQQIPKEIETELRRLLDNGYEIGILTGSPMKYIEQQCNIVHKNLSYFPCNGTQKYYFDGNGIKLKYTHNMKDEVKDYGLFMLDIISLNESMRAEFGFDVDGITVQERDSMINLCPIGRASVIKKRYSFVLFDKTTGFRKRWLSVLREKLEKYGVSVVLGGQTSFDIFPVGWDKTFMFRHIKSLFPCESVFVGDQLYKDGNDECMIGACACLSVKNHVDCLEFLRRIR